MGPGVKGGWVRLWGASVGLNRIGSILDCRWSGPAGAVRSGTGMAPQAPRSRPHGLRTQTSRVEGPPAPRGGGQQAISPSMRRSARAARRRRPTLLRSANALLLGASASAMVPCCAAAVASARDGAGARGWARPVGRRVSHAAGGARAARRRSRRPLPPVALPRPRRRCDPAPRPARVRRTPAHPPPAAGGRGEWRCRLFHGAPAPAVAARSSDWIGGHV